MRRRRDFQECLRALDQANWEFVNEHRVSKQTWVLLKRLLPPQRTDWCLGMLLGYQDPGIDNSNSPRYQNIRCLWDLSAWRSVRNWCIRQFQKQLTAPVVFRG